MLKPRDLINNSRAIIQVTIFAYVKHEIRRVPRANMQQRSSKLSQFTILNVHIWASFLGQLGTHKFTMKKRSKN